MNIQAQIDQTILNFSPGCNFGYGDLPLYSKSPNGVVKAISRLIGKNKLKRLSKGIFYRPKKGILGDIKPSDDELLRTFCFRNDQLVGYITGASLYNRLGLTTQIPKTITIAVKGAVEKVKGAAGRVADGPAAGGFREITIDTIARKNTFGNHKVALITDGPAIAKLCSVTNYLI